MRGVGLLKAAQNNHGKWASSLVSQADYGFDVVPEQSLALKKAGVRVFRIGMPRKDGTPVDIDYFQGVPDPALKKKGQSNPFVMCWQPQRTKKPSCGTMKLPPFPIVSLPTMANVAVASNVSVQYLVDITLSGVCASPA